MKNFSQANKIFIGGLSWNTTKEMLQNEFMKYGEVVDSIVMRNAETGASRGFGFVTFKDQQSTELVISSGNQHTIDGKLVDVKLCNQPNQQQQPQQQQQQIQQRQPMPSYSNSSLSSINTNKYNNCKVFVGGLPHGTQDMDVVNFFSRYGNVKEFKMMYDETKQRPRGFGFITFEQEESANQVLKEHYIQFNGKQIEIKPQMHNQRQQQMFSQNYSGQQQGYMNNFNSQNNSWRQGNMQTQQVQAQQWTNAGYPSSNNQFYVPPQSNWNSYNYYGQAGNGGQPQSTGYYQLDGATASVGAGAGYSS
ncbi:unnamed protein product [Brachionus calyciflorus]|uniref:RRM domain-containing protein n=1 Tax=Brachionus calyciflorus TaxID=104777 RepID=A0A813M1Y2_9BILA|nr:unnamed protein product [Brachionus calyciflorus]